MVLSRTVNGRTSWNCGADSIVEPDLAVFSRQISWLILSLYTQISRKVYVSPCLMLLTKFSHNVTFMVADGSAIMACCSCRFSEPTVFERYKWVTSAATVTIGQDTQIWWWTGSSFVGSLTLSKVYCWEMFNGYFMTHRQIFCIWFCVNAELLNFHWGVCLTQACKSLQFRWRKTHSRTVFLYLEVDSQINFLSLGEKILWTYATNSVVAWCHRFFCVADTSGIWSLFSLCPVPLGMWSAMSTCLVTQILVSEIILKEKEKMSKKKGKGKKYEDLW